MVIYFYTILLLKARLYTAMVCVNSLNVESNLGHLCLLIPICASCLLLWAQLSAFMVFVTLAHNYRVYKHTFILKATIMSTTKSQKVNNEQQTTNNTRSARPVVVISREQFFTAWLGFGEHYLTKALDVTKNGALKLSTARPDNKEDIKGKIHIDGKTFYLVPSSPSLKGMFTAVFTYLDYLDAVRVLAKRQANTKSRDEYCESAEGRRLIDVKYQSAKAAVDAIKAQHLDAKVESAILANMPSTDLEKIKDSVYSAYLKERGFEKDPNKK